MTLEGFNEAFPANTARGEKVCHPIYGDGFVRRLAQGVFVWVEFTNPRKDDFAVLAVSSSVCW